ncbi:hypothetical protein FQN49_001824 [Arthroderma sp. PD_2]|nr:hypothetical protein FQN49_001824 [Arthroderma sp. PD_2]
MEGEVFPCLRYALQVWSAPNRIVDPKFSYFENPQRCIDDKISNTKDGDEGMECSACRYNGRKCKPVPEVLKPFVMVLMNIASIYRITFRTQDK